MKKRGRTVFLIVGILAVVIAAAFIVLWTNIDWIVKTAIERYGSEAAKTAVRVSSVTIHLTAGEGVMNGMTVANPRGFSSPHAVHLGTISARIDTRTITARPIVIDEIRIAAPQVVYEINSSGASNLSQLKKNIQKSTADASKKATTEKKAGPRETKVLIRKLVIENGRIDVRIPALGSKPETVTLRRIELTTIGKQGGATPAQVAGQVLNALVEEAGRAVSSRFEKKLEKDAGAAVKRLFRK